MLAPDGTIRVGLAAGPDAIRKVFNDLIAQHVSNLWKSATDEEVVLQANLAKIGDSLPGLTLPDLRGREHNLAELKGEEAIVVLWSPTCPYCRNILDELRRFERANSTPRLIFVSTGSSRENRAQRIRSLILLDEQFDLGSALGANGTPSAVRLDQDLTIRSRLYVGNSNVVALLKEAEAATFAE